MIVRENESAKGWFRCERFIVSDRNWYYMTREGSQLGPFKSKKDAENDLYWYIHCAQKGKFYGNGATARELCRARHW